MTDTLCGACKRPADGGFLCTGCTDLSARSIATVGSLIPELGIAATRQDRVSTGPTESSTK